MVKYWGILFCLALFSSNTYGQTEVSGTIKHVKDTTLTFYCYKDYISYLEHPLAEFEVDSLGRFSTLLHTTDTCFVFTNINGTQHYFFVIPKCKLQLSISPDLPLGNPYQYASISKAIKVDGDGGFNAILNTIDLEASATIEKCLAKDDSTATTDCYKDLTAYIELLSTKFSSSSFTIQYVLAKQTMVEMLYKGNSCCPFIATHAISYGNPSYMEVFKECYASLVRGGIKDSLQNMVSRSHNFTQINSKVSKLLKPDNEQLAELMVLLLLNRCFYEQPQKRAAVLALADSIATHSIYEQHRSIANNLRTKLQALAVGYAPPPFKHINTKGIEVELEGLKGKYIYLSFTSVNSYGSIQDFKHLKKLYDKYNNKVEFISICIDSEDDVRNFTTKEGYTWSFLAYGNDPAIAHQYNISILPTYFLIGKDGKLIQAPAYRPNEGIEKYLK